MNATTPAVDITSLHAFYGDGGSVADVVEAVFATTYSVVASISLGTQAFGPQQSVRSS